MRIRIATVVAVWAMLFAPLASAQTSAQTRAQTPASNPASTPTATPTATGSDAPAVDTSALNAPAADTIVAEPTRRPIPYPVQTDAAFTRAIEKGTRTARGAPGPNYWTNTARYDIRATLDPSTKTLSGEATIQYHNQSPDTLREVRVHLRQNVYKEGVIRNRSVEVTGGMTVDTLHMGGMRIPEISTRQELRRYGTGYVIDGTRMRIILPDPLAPGDSLTFDTAWHFRVPGEGNFRMGQDGEVYYLGYWYPHVAVYDDVDGWVAEAYQGNGEFYMGYADYDLALTVPEGWLVASTGTLQNAEAVLTDRTRERIDRAATSDSVVTVVGPDERGAGSATAPSDDGTLTWRFRAENVRDVAFGTSDDYVWDATAADTGQGTALIHTMYRPGTAAWDRSAEYARFSIEHLSDMLLPYAYPHMTAVEGIIGGGMEFPMMTLIGGTRTPESLFGVTYHEISHMWFPMVVGTNEKRYAWMDEGTTSFNTNEGEDDFYPDQDAWDPARQWYYRYSGTSVDAPSMRHSDQYPADSPSRVLASYTKPGVMLHALRGILGEDTFFEAYRTFAARWAYKHPTPHDLFNTFEQVAGRDLDWFWTGALYEDWAMDHAVAGVESTEDGVVVTVRDESRLVMPVMLRATYADGSTVDRTVGVDAWMEGRRTVDVTLPAGTVTRVDLNPDGYLPDIDPTNDDWTASD